MWTKPQSITGSAHKESVQAVLASIEQITSAAVIAIKDAAFVAIESMVDIADPATAANDNDNVILPISSTDTVKPVAGIKASDRIAIKDADNVVKSTMVPKCTVDTVVMADKSVEQVVASQVTQSSEVDIVALKHAADEAIAKLQAAGSADVVDLKDAVTAAVDALKATTKAAVTLSGREHVPFPKLIWQIWQTKPGGPTAAEVSVIYKDLVKSWTDMNPEWTYTLIDDDQANRLIGDWFQDGDEVEIREMFLTLTDPILRADLLRLLVLYKAGGVYLDLDTKCMKPIDDWKMDELTDPNGVRLVFGIERDLLSGPLPAWWHVPVQFNNWTIAARPGSPLLKKLIFKILENLNAMAEQDNTTIAKLVPLSTDAVLEGTGPVAITRAVCKILEEDTGKESVWHHDFHKLSKPYTFHNEMLVYPKDCMAKELFPGDEHVYDPEVFLQHKFHHSWMIAKNVESKEVQGLLKKGH